MLTEDSITVQQVNGLRHLGATFVAHGPDGHTWLLKRTSPEAARRDGLAYFLRTRVLHEGRWWIADERGQPCADGNGNPFNARKAT